MGISHNRFNIENRRIISEFSEVPSTKMTDQLHKHIGVVLFQQEGNISQGKGTGILISENIALTAAHNIFDRKTQRKYTNFMFYPAVCG